MPTLSLPLTPDLVLAGSLAAVIGLICIVTAALVIRGLMRRDKRFDAPSPTWSEPTTGAALAARAAPRNRALAVGIAGLMLAMFVGVFLVGVLSRIDLQGQAPLAHTARQDR